MDDPPSRRDEHASERRWGTAREIFLPPKLVRFDHSRASLDLVLFSGVASSASVRRWAAACRLRHMRLHPHGSTQLKPGDSTRCAVTAAATASAAMSLFGRIGTQAMKYSFELTVTSLHMSIPLTQPMSVKWTRGPRTATNQPGQQRHGSRLLPARTSVRAANQRPRRSPHWKCSM